MPKGIFGYNALGVSLTMACPLKCAHCITESHPRAEGEMTTEEALKYVRDGAGAIDHVSFTGGEPFLRFDRLRTVVAEASNLGYIVSVMTSAYWAADDSTTIGKLSELKSRGVQFVGVSLDRYHLEFVSERNCVRVAEACDVLGLKLAVRTIVAKDDDYGEHVRGLLAHTGADVNVNYMVKLGRATQFTQVAFNATPRPPREKCETVTAADVVPGGDVFACCGPGLYMKRTNPLLLGNAQRESLYDILERGLQNPFMKVINTRGPLGLLTDLQANGYGNVVPVRPVYEDACQLCLDICNNPAAVSALQGLYSSELVQREQSALQFMKMFTDYRNALSARSISTETSA